MAEATLTVRAQNKLRPQYPQPRSVPVPNALPLGSILRSIAVKTKLEATDNDNFTSDLALLLDATPGTPGGDFSVETPIARHPLAGHGQMALS